MLMLGAQAASAAAAPPRATITVAPAQGTRGALVLLAGSGLPARRRATVSLGRGRLAAFGTDRRGDWTVRARVPRGARIGVSSLRLAFAGHQAIAVGFPVTATAKRGSSSTILAALSSGQQVRVSPTRLSAGSSVRLIGGGFARRAVVAVWLDQTRLETVRASARGALGIRVRIPVATKARLHVLSLHVPRLRLNVRLAVTRAAATVQPPLRPPRTPTAAPPTPAPPTPAPPTLTPPTLTPPTLTPPTPTPAPPTAAPPVTSPVPTAPPGPDPVVDAAGDLGCSPTDPNFNSGVGVLSAAYPDDNCEQQAVSNLVAGSLPTAFLTLGDNQYGTANGSNNGTLADYQQVYAPTFGRANAVVYPAVGDGDYGDPPHGDPNPPPPDDSGFMQYFAGAGVFSRIEGDGGNNANLTGNVYYSFNLGAWHIIALNSQCAAINASPEGPGGCGVGSAEEKWLKADLAAHPGMCTLAYWHVPRWNSGRLGNMSDGAAFWTDLYNAHADVVLNAHGNNHYERFLPQDPSGNPDPNGIREFIVSNGGYSHGNPPSGNPPFTPGDQSTNQVADYTSFGVLQLTLHSTSYSWRFLPANGSPFTDSGSTACHSAP